MEKRKYGYNDIVLVPKYSQLESRSLADTSVFFGNSNFKLPVVPANMKSVINIDLCEWLAKNGYFYIMHRFDINPLNFLKKCKKREIYGSISVGINDRDKDLLSFVYDSHYSLWPDYITIDVAHAHHEKALSMVKYINSTFGKANTKYYRKPFLIVGNVCTKEAVICLNKHVDAIKVGIAGGSVCTTKNKTGFGYPQFSAIEECVTVSEVPIIADGGVKQNADIAKAIAAGADMVMCGSLFARCRESAGKTVLIDGKLKKEYFGSASYFNKKKNKNIEGKRIFLDVEGSIEDKYKEIKEDLQSSISYAGGKKLADLKCCDYVVVN